MGRYAGVFLRVPDGVVRRYRPPAAGHVAIGGCLVVVVAAVVLGLAEHAASLFMAIIGVAAVATVWQALAAIKTGGLFETVDGIVNRQLLGVGYRRLAWGEIATFRAVRTRVFAVRRSGAPVALVGVAQGARTTWDEGETRDIVAVLNQRLKAHRASTGS